MTHVEHTRSAMRAYAIVALSGVVGLFAGGAMGVLFVQMVSALAGVGVEGVAAFVGGALGILSAALAMAGAMLAVASDDH